MLGQSLSMRIPPVVGFRLHGSLHRRFGAAGRRGHRRGPLPRLSVVSVLSGNRNFEGRINPEVKMDYLASPPLVVAYVSVFDGD